MSPRGSLRLLLAALPLLAARAAVRQRCSELSEGQLEGELVAPEPTLVPPAERRHSLAVPYDEACGARGVRGLLVTACDVLPPQVEVLGAAGRDWGEVRVLRLGPTWNPLLLELSIFCEPAPPPTPTDAALDTTTPGAAYGRPPGPAVEP